MRIYTVTKGGRPLAVVRAADETDAIDTAMAMGSEIEPGDPVEVRDPSDAEMVGWLERRADYIIEETVAAS